MKPGRRVRFEKGDAVRENWSHIVGTVDEVKLGWVIVRYPSGRRIAARPGHLLHIGEVTL